MAGNDDLRPIIIKRKKVIAAGHHGGAWKVAYADFVTAMMAFFMLMWLLSAATEQQRAGIADYFAPTVPIHRMSGGGDGLFNGASNMAEDTAAKEGTGASATYASDHDAARGDAEAQAAEEAKLKSLEEDLVGQGGESAVMENALRHIVTRTTDEGLIIELFDLEGIPLFKDDTSTPNQILRDLAIIIAELSKTVTNTIAISGHVSAQPIVSAQNTVWPLSADRASAMRELLEEKGVPATRIVRLTGHAEREPVTRNPMSERNNRLEIILLRDGQ